VQEPEPLRSELGVHGADAGDITARTVETGNKTDIKARLANLGADAMPMTPANYGKFIADEIGKWGKVVQAANIKAD